MASVLKQIPGADTPLSERRALRDERAEKYPIEVLGDTGSLSGGRDDPTLEDLWGDPVNLLYPLAYAEDTSPDLGRAANARARFKQFAPNQYSDETSIRTVHERIVRAELQAGVSPEFDPDDRLDAMLPEALSSRMVQKMSLQEAIDKARARFSSTPRIPTLSEVAKELGSFHASLNGIDETLAERYGAVLITLAEVSKAFAGEPINPADFGFPVTNVSTDENYAPVDSDMVIRDQRTETRSITNPLATPNLLDVNEVPVPNMGFSPDSELPGPRTPSTNVDPNAPMRLPEQTPPTGAAWEPSGVAKSLDFGSDSAL